MESVQNSPLFPLTLAPSGPYPIRNDTAFGATVFIVEDDFEGEMPLDWMRRSEFERGRAFIESIENPGNNFILKSPKPEWRRLLIENLQLCLTRPTSRGLIFTCLDEGITITFQEGPESDCQKGRSLTNFVITFALDDGSVCTLKDPHTLASTEHPPHIVIAHELIHTLHLFNRTDLIEEAPAHLLAKLIANRPETRYLGGHYSCQLDDRHTNLEELNTIEGLDPTHNQLTENRVREEFGLPARIFHQEYYEGMQLSGSGYIKMPPLTNQDLLIAFYRNDATRVPEILQIGSPPDLLEHYFKGIESPTNFSQVVLSSLDPRLLDDVVMVLKIADSQSFREAILAYAIAPSLSLKDRFIVTIGLSNQLKFATEYPTWVNSAILIIEQTLRQSQEIPPSEVFKDPFLRQYSLVYALHQNENVVCEVLNDEEVGTLLTRFARIVESLGEHAKVFDDSIKKVVYKMGERHLSRFTQVPSLLKSSYLRDRLLQSCADPAFVKGKEPVMDLLRRAIERMSQAESVGYQAVSQLCFRVSTRRFRK